MSEHRTLFGSLGITLLGIGLAGYVSLQVSGAVAGHPVRLGPTAHLCEWLIGIGTALFTLVVCSLVHQWYVKFQLLRFTAKGVLLSEDVRVAGNDDEEAFNALDERYREWVGGVFDFLKMHDTAAGVHFANEAGRLVTEGLMGGGGMAGLRAKIDTRLARLGEISEKRL